MKRRKREQPSVEMQMGPMIDMVFLLLVFFMVTAKPIKPEADINLERLDEGVSASEDVVVLDPVDPKREAPSRLDLDLALAMGEDVNIKGFGLVGTLGGVTALDGA